MMNNPLLPLLAPGDRVRVIGGKNLGAVGTVQGWEAGKVLVKSDEKGTVRAIAPAWLAHIPGSAHSDPIPWDVGAEPLQDEIPDSVESWGVPRDNDEQIGAEPLDLLTSVPTEGGEPLQALEALRTTLQKTALTKAWLESAGRGYVRLSYYKSVGKPPVYVNAKDAVMWRDRIAAGRALAHCEALIKYLGTLEQGFSGVHHGEEQEY